MKRIALMAVAAAGVAVLAGCHKPNPGATVWSGTNSTHAQAACWSFDINQGIDLQSCARTLLESRDSGDSAPEVSVIPGNVIGISVDPQVAEDGWIVRFGGQALVEQPITSTYFRFTMPDLAPIPAEGLALEIISQGETDLPRGLWVYRIMPGQS